MEISYGDGIEGRLVNIKPRNKIPIEYVFEISS